MNNFCLLSSILEILFLFLYPPPALLLQKNSRNPINQQVMALWCNLKILTQVMTQRANKTILIWNYNYSCCDLENEVKVSMSQKVLSRWSFTEAELIPSYKTTEMLPIVFPIGIHWNPLLTGSFGSNRPHRVANGTALIVQGSHTGLLLKFPDFFLTYSWLISIFSWLFIDKI